MNSITLKQQALSSVLALLLAGCCGFPQTAATKPPAAAAEPNSSDYWINKGVDMEKSGDHETALEYYEKGLQINPKSYVGNFDKGNALAALSRFEEAIQAYDQALLIAPKASLALYGREVVRLRASGLKWPNGQDGLELLSEDIKGSDPKIRIGAALLLFVECGKNKKEEVCAVLVAATEADPNIMKDIGNLEQR
jgi:tetratricopeptide (TPR) repeat protein